MPKRQKEILVRNLRLDRLEELPTSVFPICIDVTLSRSPRKDDYLLTDDGEQIRTPQFPVDVKISTQTPYISTARVYLENPAEFPNSGETLWPFEEFAEELAYISQRIETVDTHARNRIYLNGMRLCEVESKHVYVDGDGQRSVDRSLYEDREEIAIADFEKRPRVSAKEVREQLGSAAAGNVIKPLRLTNAELVHAKEHRGSNQTTGESTRRMYFSEAQAEQYNQPQYAPKTISNLTWGVMENYFGTLSETEYLAWVEFEGDTQSSEQFVEDGVTFLEGDDGDGERKRAAADGGRR